MFDKFVQNKIDSEIVIADSIEPLSRDGIAKSNLSEFTKNYLLNETNEIPEREQMPSKIEKSNKLYLNYTLRPKWTLLTILFNNFESRPPSEIIRKLSLFPFYNYYGDSIRNFINDNFQIFVTKSEVTSIIDRTNKAIYEKLSVEINNAKVKNLLLQLFVLKYGEEPNWNLESVIPFSFIKIFLEDKSFAGLLRKFDIMKDLNDESDISLKDILKVLTDKFDIPKIETPQTEPVKQEEKKVEKTGQTKDVKNNLRILPADQKKTVTAETKPLEKTQKKIEVKLPVKTKDAAPVATDKIYSKDLLKASSEESADIKKPEPPSLHDLKDLFNEKQLDKIADRIYNSDLVFMEKSFNKMNHYKTWFETSNHLKEIFNNNRVDIYNKDVVYFVDTLSEYYKGRE